MIVYGSLIVVIIVTLIFYFLNPKKILIWEFFIPIAVTLAIIFGTKALINYANVTFTEYWGETIVSVYEEEPYNYWKTETCSRTYACGTDSKGNTQYCTEYYDCSHQEDVGPSWWNVTDLNNHYSNSEHLYDSLVRLYGTPKVVVEQKENYDSDDRAVSSNGTKFQGKAVGDYSYIYKYSWPKTEKTRKGVFSEHSYENRIKASDLSLFNISVITDKQADSMGLYKYPELDNYYSYPTILGKNIPLSAQKNFEKLNARFGVTNKLRLWVLVFDNKLSDIASYQENYWVKGNKNELVICIGRNGDEIQWAHSFSWGTSGDLTAEVSQKVLELYSISIETTSGQKAQIIPLITPLKTQIAKVTNIDTSMLPPVLPLNINKKTVTKIQKSSTPILTEKTWEAYYQYLDKNLNRFEKRSFKEFSYLKVEPKTWQVVLIYIIALVVSIGVNIWTTKNQFEDYGN